MSDPARELIDFLFLHVAEIPERDLWAGVEALQAYIDELGKWVDNLPPYKHPLLWS